MNNRLLSTQVLRKAGTAEDYLQLVVYIYADGAVKVLLEYPSGHDTLLTRKAIPEENLIDIFDRTVKLQEPQI
jgi:hypothetical protein